MSITATAAHCGRVGETYNKSVFYVTISVSHKTAHVFLHVCAISVNTMKGCLLLFITILHIIQVHTKEQLL